MLKRSRHFFEERQVMEVETPLLYPSFATDPYMSALTSKYTGPIHPHGKTLFLQSSPEYAMKRLLAAGSGSIFQISKAFRNGEYGQQHNPEFTLLEWYRVDMPYDELITEVTDYLTQFFTFKTIQTRRYQTMFTQHLNIDPFHTSIEQLGTACRQKNIPLPETNASLESLLDYTLDRLIQRHYSTHDTLLILNDFPTWQAQMAAPHPENPHIVQRFECYVNGVELSNGYQELTDATIQRQRFNADNRQRQAMSMEEIPLDEAFLEALDSGLPECSGVALGIDRLLMLMSKHTNLEKVLPLSLSHL